MRASLPLVSLALLCTPGSAFACGGFFCSQVPIDQSKERIVFAIDEAEREVEAHVQIFYSGAAQEFAWVVPVPSVPLVGLSVDALFDLVSIAFAPSYALSYEYLGDCVWPPSPIDTGWSGGDDTDAPSDADEDGGGGGVVIVDQSQVGPYDTVTLQATSDEALLTWLRDNDYDLPAGIGANLAPYVAQHSYFVALKLSNNRTSGDIAPIRLTWEGEAASIPLVLTAIAATPDMRLETYVLGAWRAVPDNYLHVTVSDAAIDWISWGSNYDQVITDAANEAGGQAFATDFAGPSEGLRGVLWSPGRYEVDVLRAVEDPALFVDLMLDMGFPRSQQVQALIRQFIPMPPAAVAAGVEERWFYNCLDCYPEYLRLIDFNPTAFADTLEEVIVEPSERIDGLFWDYPWISRLTSSVSPAEMTADPVFVLNHDLGPVSNFHEARYVTDCRSSDGDPETAVRWIELADSTRLIIDPSTYMPWRSEVSAAVVQDLGASGAGVVLVDNRQAVLDGLAQYNDAATAAWEERGVEVFEDTDPPELGEIEEGGGTERPPAGSGDPEDLEDAEDEDKGGSCGCDGVGVGPGLGLALVALAARRRRG
jgi:hypothetical protein